MDSNIGPYASKATMPWMHGHGFKHESHRNQSSNPFKAHSLADAFIFTFPCPRFSNSIVHPSGEQRTLIRSTLRFSMQLKKLPPPPLHSKESALLLLFECLSKCHPLSLSDRRSGYRIWPFFSPSPTIFNLRNAQVVWSGCVSGSGYKSVVINTWVS